MTLLKEELVRDEAQRLKPYKDSVGKTTIGVGRNLDDVGVSQDEVDLMLSNDIARTTNELSSLLPWWTTLDEVRQRVIVNMAFNMGVKTLLTFTNTLKAVQEGRYVDASQGMRASKWAEQVGPRAVRLSDMMATGAVA